MANLKTNLTYEEACWHGYKIAPCSVCGKNRNRAKKFCRLMREGEVKADVETEMRKLSQAWEKESFVCRTCELREVEMRLLELEIIEAQEQGKP